MLQQPAAGARLAIVRERGQGGELRRR
jgi:hypothetical protein